MTAQELADLLRTQASSNNGTITLNDTVLGTKGLDALVKRDLQRRGGSLLLTVDPAKIPEHPPAGGFTLEAIVPGGSSGFLRLDARRTSIGFTVGATIDISLRVETRRAANGSLLPWVFSTSFPELAYQSYDDLDLDAPMLDFTTAGAQPGLTFVAALAPQGVFAALATLMHLSGTYSLTGALLRDAKGTLTFALQADLGLGSFGIGSVIALEKPHIGITYTGTSSANGEALQLVELYLGATAAFGADTGKQVALDVRAAMPQLATQTPLLQLVVLPKNFSTSLSNLGSLVAGQSWDNFFGGPASVLKPYFDTFGFLGYSMTFSTGAKVTSLSLSVGTLRPWKLWGDYALTLDGTWNVLFLGSGTVQSLTLHACFNYDDKMFFDVVVQLPNLRISGRQSGAPISLTMADVNKKLFDGALAIPGDLFGVSIGSFSIEIDKPAQTIAIGVVANLSVSLFGAQLLAVHNMALSVTIDASGPKKIYTGSIDGQISLGPITAAVDAVLSNDPAVGCVFTVHLVNETVGSMLGHLVHLVDPTYDVSFGQPWDKLLDISLDALVLKVDITKKTVSIAYVDTIDLGFMTITELGLSWTKNANGPSSTKIALSGTFLGVGFGTGSGNPPLSWDPINENPPAVPGGGSKIFDLEYIGIGQHVSFDPSWQPVNVEDVIGKLEKLALPAGGSNLPNLTSKDGLRFAAGSGWLIGADFTILGTLRLAIVFNDPNLYGILISLAGERAKSFAGLKFEILYRKVTDTIGVYHIELKLPDAMRHLEFGEVSLTLPVIILDIYTNGNFRVDFGFPKGLDFSNSFCLQVFPFVGYGGFYFALLNGETSSRVPKITNGRFSPVIEFGIALSVGVGKTIDEGILAGGISVTVVGILEGVIGWFNPTDAAIAKDEYYRIQGTIAITGRLYGTINFAIIQASLSVTAYASVTLIIEAHSPIYIAMSVGVSVEVSIKIVFFTIHCSFSATISASFTIGLASATPWKLQGGGGASTSQLFGDRGGVHAPQQRFFAALRRFERANRIALRLAAGEVTLTWNVQTVFSQHREIGLHAMPAFTKADGGGVAGILLLGIGDGIEARAGSLAAHLAAGPQDALPGIADVLEGLVRWGIVNARASLGKTTPGVVDADDVALLARVFADDETLSSAMNYAQYLSGFLGANYRFSVAAPAAGANGGDTGVAVFPMPPVLKMTAGTVSFDFATDNALDDTTLAKMRAYFELLAVDYEKFVAQQQSSGVQPEAQDATITLTPVAQVVFEQYFAMLMRAAIKAAGDVMQRYTFSADDASKEFGLTEIRTQLGDPALPPIAVVSANRDDAAILAQGAHLVFGGVRHQIALGESFASIATAFNAVLAGASAITAQQIADANAAAGGIFIAGTVVNVAGLSWTTLPGETLNLVLARIYTRATTPAFIQGIPGLQTLAQAILGSNPTIFPGLDPIAALNIPIDPIAHPQVALPASAATFATYQTTPGDTSIGIAAMILAMQLNLVDLAGGLTWVLAHNTLSVTDPNAAQPTGTVIALPPVVHALENGESILSLTTRLLTVQATVTAALLTIAGPVNLLAPHALLALPVLTYALRSGDTFASIAQLFNLTLDALAAALAGGKAPAIFKPGAAVIVSDVEEMTVTRLVSGLAATQWKTLAPMASRFMLAGLRLPDPNDPAFQKLSLEEMTDPTKLGDITTLGLYRQTGQQFAIASPPPSGYTIQLALSASAPWFELPQPLSFGLTAAQVETIAEIVAATFAPVVELTALPLFRLSPARYTLAKHVSWQPAALPNGAIYNPATFQNVTGNPDLWIFPDALIARLQADGVTQPPYTVAVGTQESATSGMTVRPATGYAWATALRCTVQQLPADEAGMPAAANIVNLVGTDDNGLALLDALLARLADNDDASVYLLYPPNPASATGGLLSDDLAATTALLQTNLSTLSHSGNVMPRPVRSPFLSKKDTADPVYVAPIDDAAAFLRLVWECSIVRSGGYYLRYVDANGNAGLPPSLFTTSSTAELTLLVVLDSQNVAHAPILPFNTCAIVADNIDAADSNVFVESATWLVAAPSSLADAAGYAAKTFGIKLAVDALATLNADVPQLLRPGASVQVPDGAGGTKTDSVRIDDTLTTLAVRNGLVPATLATYGTNAAARILVPTGIVQFFAGALVKRPAIPAGSAGFALTRANPDPGNTLALSAMNGTAIVEELFHMLGSRIVPNGAPSGAAFLRSGEGIPAGPAQSTPTENSGPATPATPNERWDYGAALSIAPFALRSHGSTSPALPPAAQNPYAGVDPSAAVTLSFAFHDPFGNTQPMPAGAASLAQPVRYFDELVGLGQWPSTAAGYLLSGEGTLDPSLDVQFSMRLDKYLPTASVSSARAAQNVAADATTFRRAYYQLAQPDVSFTLSTTIEAPQRDGTPTTHALAPKTFRDYVSTSLVVLDALAATRAVVFTAKGGETLGSIADTYDIAPADLFGANGDALYSTVFGTAQLTIPQLYTTVAGDTLAGIAAAQKLDPLALAKQNPWATLSATIDLVAPDRTMQPAATDSLSSIAATYQCSVSGLAQRNALAPLTDGLAVALAGVVITTCGDDLTSLAKKFSADPQFAAHNVTVTIPEIAVANQLVSGLFRTPVTLTVDDIVPRTGDSLGGLKLRLGFSIETLAGANETLADLFAAGTSLYVAAGTIAPVPAAGTTVAVFAANESVPLRALGLALYDGVVAANPPALNRAATLAAGAALTIPATVTNAGIDRYAPYVAQSSDVNIATIAAKFLGDDPLSIGAASVDQPDLFVVGTPVRDAASGMSIPTVAGSTFASLVDAFAAKKIVVTPGSLARDNASTKDLVRPGGRWLCPPMVAIAQPDGSSDTLARIAARYGLFDATGVADVRLVLQTNAAVLGFIASGVKLTYGGTTIVTIANDTLNALIGRFTPPGGTPPAIADLADAFANVALVPPGALVLPTPLTSAFSLDVAPSFTAPIVRLGVTIAMNRGRDWVAGEVREVAGVAASVLELSPQSVGGGAGADVLSLDAFATTVETAIPGVRVATGKPQTESDDPTDRRLWLVNFGSAKGQKIAFQFEDAKVVRSFAIPPLSTSLSSGTAPVIPYVSGTGLSGNAFAVVFAGIDLDVWGAQFLTALDLVLSPAYAVPAQEAAPKDFETIVGAKRMLATSIAGRVQYVLDGGGPGEYGEADPRRANAIAAMEQALAVRLSDAYTINSLLQAAVEVDAPYTDVLVAPRLSGMPKLTQPNSLIPVRNASLSTSKVPLAKTTVQNPALTTFLLTVQSPADQRSAEVNVAYAVTELEVPSAPPAPDGYQTSTWLTLVHPLENNAGLVDDVTLPIPLRAYPLPPTLRSQTATASYPAPETVDQLVRWNADAAYAHRDADQDTARLRLDVGIADDGLLRAAIATTDALFAALAQFVSVYPALQNDLALLVRRPAGAAPSAIASAAVSAFATIASGVASAWPSDAIVAKPPVRAFASVVQDEIVPGTYGYTLVRPRDSSVTLTTLTLIADDANPVALWPLLSVDDGTGFRPLTRESSTPAQAVYRYPAGIPKGIELTYDVGLTKLDVVITADLASAVALERNADLVGGAKTCDLFVYRTPYTAFPTPLVPLLVDALDFDIGSGPVSGLWAALQTFLRNLLARPAAPANAKRTLRVAASYGYELTNAVQAAGVRGAASAGTMASGIVSTMPIVLVPSIELTINGDGNASIDAFAKDLAGFVADWDDKVNPSHVNAAVFFEVALFSNAANSYDKPLLDVRSVRYELA